MRFQESMPIQSAISGLEVYGGSSKKAEYIMKVLKAELDDPSGRNYLKINPIKLSVDGTPFRYINIEKGRVNKKLILSCYEGLYPGHIDHWTNNHK